MVKVVRCDECGAKVVAWDEVEKCTILCTKCNNEMTLAEKSLLPRPIVVLKRAKTCKLCKGAHDDETDVCMLCRSFIYNIIARKFRHKPAKRKVALEMLDAVREGIQSPRGGLWAIWLFAKERSKHADTYAQRWYAHAREVLKEVPELAKALNVDVEA
ncbi:MAG: hypothetical protein QW734_05265 [Candidatus Bathyarchaeia archaeon]